MAPVAAVACPPVSIWTSKLSVMYASVVGSGTRRKIPEFIRPSPTWTSSVTSKSSRGLSYHSSPSPPRLV
jgi:hypothetical protein